MQLSQYAHLFNVAGFAIVLVVSATVLRSFGSSYYRSWLAAYGCGMLFLTSQAVITFTGPVPLVATLGLSMVVAMIWFLTQTRQELLERPTVNRRLFPAIFIPSVLLIGILVHEGQFNLAAALPGVCLTIAYVRLGRAVLQQGNQTAAAWLGYPLILTGFLPMTFPLTANTAYEWIGYFFGGLFNLVNGIGMLVYLLQESVLQLQRKNEELMRVDELKSNFISTISHEFRTPLTAIKSAAWLIGRLPEQREELVGTLTNNVDQLDRLVGDVLDFSQMEAGLMRYRKQTTVLAPLVEQATKSMGPMYQQKGVTLAFTSSVDGLEAELDAEKAAIVLRNLLSNALKFTPAGGTVAVRLDGDDQAAVITVEDNGIGIPPEHQAAIFDKFFQVDNTSTRRAGGTGLGLAISRAIVEDGHGGMVTVKSTPGEGSTFSVRFPLTAISPKSEI